MALNKHDIRYYTLSDNTIKEIEGVYDEVIKGLSTTIITANIAIDKRFLFKDYPYLNKLVNKKVKLSGTKVIIKIRNSIADAWTISNDKNDDLVKSKWTKSPTAYMGRNEEALKAFQSRKVNGFTVSERVWKYTDTLKTDLESAIDAALEKGTSAAQLSRNIKQYLNDPDARFRRIRTKWGNLRPSANQIAYNPGQGVYASANKNAMRLARTEINKAYRTADHTRWQQMDMVVGYRIQTSPRSITAVCPICEQLAGVYPKNFKFVGFHIQCRCVCIPILCSDADFRKLLAGKEVDLKQPALPRQFTSWYEKNKGKLKENSLPDWFKDNKGLLKAG